MGKYISHFTNLQKVAIVVVVVDVGILSFGRSLSISEFNIQSSIYMTIYAVKFQVIYVQLGKGYTCLWVSSSFKVHMFHLISSSGRLEVVGQITDGSQGQGLLFCEGNSTVDAIFSLGFAVLHAERVGLMRRWGV